LHLSRNQRLAISLLYYLITKVIFDLVLRLAGRPPKPELTILYYHSVPANHRRGFARQMDALSRMANVVPASYRGNVPQGKQLVAITFDDAFVSVLENAMPELAARSFHCTVFVPVDLVGRTPTWTMDDFDDGDETVMSAQQLREACSILVTFGSHTLTHPHLSRISLDRAQEEIQGSRQALKKLIQQEVQLFAVPYGDYNHSIIELCKEAGYQFIFTNVPTRIDPSQPEVVRGRTSVDPFDTPVEFFLKCNGAYAWMRHTSALKGKFRAAINRTSGTARPVTRVPIVRG
jgi:peptidoglycan/xylan/chitin deacetylase (PgdA/CDA1 family)